MPKAPQLATVLIALSALASCGDNIDNTVDIDPKTVGDFVRVDERLTTLKAAFEEADLLDSLDVEGPLTLFAPTNAAVEALLTELSISESDLLELAQLADFLRYHVHEGALSLAQLERRTAITTRAGAEIHVRFGLDGILLNDGVEVTAETITAENGTIYLVEAALKRPLITTTRRVESAPDLALQDATEENIGFTFDFLTINDPGVIHGLQVLLDIEHSRVFDLVIFLENQSAGVFIPLVNRPFSALSDINVTLADSATFDIVDDVSFDNPDGQAFPQRAYRPLDPLESLIGQTVAGEWSLTIIDPREGETGVLRSWGLVVTYGEAAPEPAIVYGRATGGAGVLPQGFTEAVNVAITRVGGLDADVELTGTAGELQATPATIPAAQVRGGLTFDVATDAALGDVEISVAASAGAVSRIKEFDGSVVAPDANNIDLVAHVPLTELGAAGFQGNDIWGWVDPQDGTEYALMGTEVGTAFVNLADPANPVVVGLLPTATDPSGWRDIKVYQDHAFVVSEADGHGLQVFDLTQLRGSTAPQTFAPTAVNTDFGNAHNIAINEDTGFAYVVGATGNFAAVCFGGLLMLDITTPTSPTTVGCFAGGVPAGQTPGPAFPTDAYIHDVQCVTYNGPDTDYQGREICVSSDGQIANDNNYIAIADVTDKANVVQVARTSYLNAGYSHQGWLTEDHRYFILNDEFDELIENANTRTYIWDLTDLDAPTLLGTFDNPRDAVGHNTYIKGNLAYQANYTSGLRVVDISDIANGNAVEVGYFDTFPEDDADDDGNQSSRCARPPLGAKAPGPLPHPDQGDYTSTCGVASLTGAWSNYPFFDSGLIVISDMRRGLFVVQPGSSLAR